MTGGKKWMTVLREEHHEWLKEVMEKDRLRRVRRNYSGDVRFSNGRQ
jgi:hypothetical protein